MKELLASKKWHVDEAPWIVVGKKLRTKSPLCLTAKAEEEAVIRVLLRWGATVLEEDTTHKGDSAGLQMLCAKNPVVVVGLLGDELLRRAKRRKDEVRVGKKQKRVTGEMESVVIDCDDNTL